MWLWAVGNLREAFGVNTFLSLRIDCLFVMQIEGLMMDIAAAEEEINRWKLAAEQEAAAGTGVEQQFVAQVWNAIS